MRVITKSVLGCVSTLAILSSGCASVKEIETKVTLDIGINDSREKDRVMISIGTKY